VQSSKFRAKPFTKNRASRCLNVGLLALLFQSIIAHTPALADDSSSAKGTPPAQFKGTVEMKLQQNTAAQTSSSTVDQAAEFIENARKLHIYRWKDASKTPRAVVVAVHGTTQHAGSFGTLAQHLASMGFIFIGLDLRGHGERFYKAFAGQPNYRVDYDKSADDLGNLLRKVKSTYPGLPVFCLGESVGAAVATHCAARYKGLSNGIILCSPGTHPRAFNPFMVVPDFVKGITHLDIPMDVSRYIDTYSSDDKRVSDEMIADPLSRIKLTPKEILRTAFFIRTTPKAAKDVDPALPVLIVQGEEDGIVSKKSTHKIMKNLPGDHKELVEFKDAGHVLLGTSFLKPQVIDSVSKWLCEQTDLVRSKVIGLKDTGEADSKKQ
jgi:acylglycerol lipase